MAKRFVVLIEDDFEVMGNGLGHVASLQFLPSLALMNIAREFEAKLTFMVDVAHQLVLNAHIEDREVKIQKELWDQTVQLIHQRGFDVQLHLHPQWLQAHYKAGHFYVSDKWNIGQYPADQQETLISTSIQYLKDLLRPNRPEYEVCAFKAGSWGMQPSLTLLSSLKRHGIKIVMGARDGMKITGTSVDYENMEEKFIPYFPQFDDVTKKSDSQREVVMLPLQPYAPDLLTFTILLFDHLKDKLQKRMPLSCLHGSQVPAEIAQLCPDTGIKMFELSWRPYRTHLKIGNQPFYYLKHSFDAVIERLRKLELERIPIVIESHTKQYEGYYEHIKRFLGHISENYKDEVEFGDMTSYAKELQRNKEN